MRTNKFINKKKRGRIVNKNKKRIDKKKRVSN